MDICFHRMAQISSSDEFKQRSSPILDPARPKDVDKEEALQMEAEALAKMQKERVVVGSRQKSDTLSYSWPSVQSCRKQDHDLMVFPESDGKKKVDDKLNSIDIDKLTRAELEKILLEENLESNKPSTLSAPQILGASSSQFYSHPVAQSGQWTSSLPGSSTSAGSSVYPVPSFNKQVGIFQNGFHPGVSAYQSTKPAYLCLPERSQYISYPLPFTSTFHPQGSVPMYHSTLTPEMAKVFDKIASTSEFQKNGKSKTDLEMTGAKPTISLPISESSNDISKFDWLDLDPLSKPKVDNIDIFYTSEDGGKITNAKVVEDPWDAVLLEEKSPGKGHLERKLSGKSASGATVTRSQSLNIRTAQLAKLQGQTAQCDLVYTFFHPLPRDEKAEGIDGITRCTDTGPSSPTSGKVGGEVKLSISYRNKTLFIMVMHIKDLVDFPSLPFDIIYKIPQAANNSTCNSIDTLEKDSRERLLSIISKEGTYGLSRKDKAFLWDKRHYCYTHAGSLPKILASAPNWDLTNLPEIYLLLQQWPPLPPLTALELLNANFADQEVRTKAVQWIEAINDDELADILPQFVQALKYETYLDNSLVRFLLARALGNIRIAHYLYWLLKDTLHDTKHGIRYEHILGAFLSICGKSLREELERQSRLVQLLGMVAEKVKQTSGSARQMVLQSGMERVQSFFLKNKCRLPLSPSLVAKELNVKACSYFSSNAVPLKIALVNADPLGEEINVMFKVGEDLRQDMLALQMIKIMDKIWLQEGLDLRMVMFKCLATGKDRGMVELVPASDTLRKIQVEYGVTGSFKDKPLAEWLRKYNSTEEEYEKASENFIYSCAGCCVATYVLGICDRHNDNIMLRSTGHMFHIDFGKFLGHAQMFGSFKRDRAPFVLTSDMAYVINGGEKPTIRFQLFVDLCCQAYNLIRKQANLFLNLLSLMMSSGLPELSGIQDLKYVQDALQPQTTDAEATIFFTSGVLVCTTTDTEDPLCAQASKYVRRHEFNIRNQMEGESINEYVVALRKAAVYCEFRDLDELILDCIICGMRDITLQRRLPAKSNLSLQIALDKARASESAAKSTETLQRQSAPQDAQKSTRVHRETTKPEDSESKDDDSYCMRSSRTKLAQKFNSQVPPCASCGRDHA
ncbi:PREDICTED: phosphatidylinositol 4-phosphate 3-kinase C2 domain-containing subunit alpha-like [Thamnophis sirtalis]|uniref:Phosphatidylinositol 4-phosphate 3-kinase C2 domain-containing subunit alpha-like n=1 Tax=Thamnophis sirtalis TaxID=35019 RepID=A0A6I9YQ00_9SAUR|nr:PREDICTED: phosphatidylinositol 4-phosphate 3-kinase C2 domain-containing subunit alpha-like [Thamnophis sirtalis]